MDSRADLVIVAIDFDGTLVEKDVQPLRWRPGALEFVTRAPLAGIRLRLHSCRCAIADTLRQSLTGDADALTFWRTGIPAPDAAYSWSLFEEMRGFLAAAGVLAFFEIWDGPGKPFADRYIDDKAEQPDWLALARELGVALTNAEQGRNRPLVGDAAIIATPTPTGIGAAATAAVAGQDAPTAAAGLRV